MLRFLFFELDRCSMLLELDSNFSALEEAEDEENDENEDEEAGATALEKARASGPPALAWRFQSKRRAGGKADSSGKIPACAGHAMTDSGSNAVTLTRSSASK